MGPACLQRGHLTGRGVGRRRRWLAEGAAGLARCRVVRVRHRQAANTVAIAAARHQVLAEAGWDVEQQGLGGGPPLRVVATGERHATIDRALRLLGIGAGALEPVATTTQGAIDVADLSRTLASGPAGPTIVCLQAGNVNSGAFDDLTAATATAHDHGAWVHVDGAFGLWAAANPATRHLVTGIEAADSWATDGHKWLNVPYDCGYVFCAHPDAHRAAMSYTAAYLTGQGGSGLRAPADYVLESSRRARGFATWAALRQLGRTDVAELVERCCALARRFADQLSAVVGATVVNDVVLNQVLVRFGDDEKTDRVVDAVQRSGECWMGDDLARPAPDAHLSVELAHEGSGRRPLGRRRLGGNDQHRHGLGAAAAGGIGWRLAS